MKLSYYLVFFISFISSCKKDAGVIIYSENNNIVAHRGAWKDDNLPPNSVAALQRAIEMKCAGSEFDIWLTKDDSVVVEHDIKFGGKVIENNNYSTLAINRLSNGEMLPTLRSFLSVASYQNQTKLFIELKTMNYNTTRRDKLVDEVLKLVNETQMQDHVIYTSFVFYFLQRIHQLSPSSKTLFLGGTLSPASIYTNGISGISYDVDTLNAHKDWLQVAKKNNLILSSWTVNDVDQYVWLLNNKTDYIITDAPNKMFRKLDKMR